MVVNYKMLTKSHFVLFLAIFTVCLCEEKNPGYEQKDSLTRKNRENYLTRRYFFSSNNDNNKNNVPAKPESPNKTVTLRALSYIAQTVINIPFHIIRFIWKIATIYYIGTGEYWNFIIAILQKIVTLAYNFFVKDRNTTRIARSIDGDYIKNTT